MTDDDLDRHIRAIIAREGGWANDPDDSGGPTNYGITLNMWRHYCVDRRYLSYMRDERYLQALPEGEAHGFYTWYFRTQGLAELIDEFGIPDKLVPLVMDMRTLHSMEGCRKILSYSEWSAMEGISNDVWECVITLFRIQYMLEVAERNPKDRKYVRGWMHRALKAIGMWPPREEQEVREA